MDFVKKFAGSHGDAKHGSDDSHSHHVKPATEQSSGGGFLDKLSGKFNTAAGGGRESEKNEDYLDKGVDFIQEKFLGQGKQDNESAVEQAKDEAISDTIRKQYKNATGKEFPIKDKPTKFGH